MGKQRSAVEHTSAAEAATWAIAGGTAEAVPSRKSRSRDMAKAVPSPGSRTRGTAEALSFPESGPSGTAEAVPSQGLELAAQLKPCPFRRACRAALDWTDGDICPYVVPGQASTFFSWNLRVAVRPE